MNIILKLTEVVSYHGSKARCFPLYKFAEPMKNLLNFYENMMLEWWDNSRNDKFTDENSIPDLPITDSKTWEEFYVPILIQRGAIPKDQLKKDHKYLGSCRNSSTAVWNGTQFEYHRVKFGIRSHEFINHFQDDDGYDLFVPIKDLGITVIN